MADATSTTCIDGYKTIPTAQTSSIQPTTGISSLSSQSVKFGSRVDRNPPSASLGKVDTTRAIMTPNIHRNNSREVTPAVEQQKRQQLEEVHLPLKKRRVDDEQKDRRRFMPTTTTATLQPPPLPPPLLPPQEQPTTRTSSSLSINNNPKYTRRPSSSSVSSTKDNNHLVGRSAGVPKSSMSDKPRSSAVRPVSVFHLVRQRRRRRQQSPRPLCVGSNPNFPLPSNGIVEIAGPAGAGKSQLAMSLCADCVSSNSKAKAVYVFLGGSGRSHQHTMAQRLNVMLRARWDVLMRRQEEGRRQQQRDRQVQQLVMSPSSNPATAASTAAGATNNNITDELDEDEVIRDCLNRVYLRWIRNSDELMELLESGLPQFLQQHPTTKVVVLDGIANLFRINEELAFVSSSRPMNPWHNRAVTFFQISRMCRKTSSDFHVPFVVTNEATSKIRPVQKSSTTSSFRINNSFDDDSSDLEPALGLAWFQCVDSRFFVKRGQRRSVPNPIFRKVQTRNDNRVNNNDNNNNNNKDHNLGVHAAMSTNTDNVLIRTVRCIKAPNISTSGFGAFEFWIDQRGAVPLRIIV